MIFASERLQSPGEEGEQRQEDGVCGGVPPQSHAQWRDALHHEFHAEVGPVEHEVERHEDEAPEQEFAFHDPHAFEVGFDGLLFVEKEPSGDGEEDDDADFAAALHHELEEDAFRSQGEFQPLWTMKWCMRIMNIAMMRNSSMLEFLHPPHLNFWSVPVRRV